jgi:hypothetical protein
MNAIISVIHSGDRVSVISPALPNIMIMYFTGAPQLASVRTPVGRSRVALLDIERSEGFLIVSPVSWHRSF